jgi:hypothetical protein
MGTKKTRDDIYTHEWAKQLPEAARPLCPQFRACPIEELGPVRGHCLLSRSPGWFMIPHLDTYGRYCTRSGFTACEWFGAGDEMVDDGADAWPAPPMPVGVWNLPPTGRARS